MAISATDTPHVLRGTGSLRLSRRGNSWRVIAGAALVAIAALGGCEKPAEAPPPSPVVPPTVGEVSLSTPKEMRALIEAGKGQVVVVNFWATWCPPCVKEMPEFSKFYREFEGKGVTFLSFTADFAATKDEVVVPFMKSYEIPFPTRIMAVDNPDELAKELPVEWDGALPATFIFAPDGTVAWQTIGGTITRDMLAEKVEALQ